MEKLIKKYEQKLITAGLCEPGQVLFGGMDADLLFNQSSREKEVLIPLFSTLSINTVLFARPKEPYATILDYLAETSNGPIRPNDTETRTFLHELPIVEKFSAGDLTAALQKRKVAIVPGKGLVTFGTVSPEQAFVVFSSVCFATFVKFFSDYLALTKAGKVSPRLEAAFKKATAALPPKRLTPPPLTKGPLTRDEQIITAMCEAGRATVDCSLVDSYFGNISCFSGETIYISQTGSSLDELEGHIDPVPLDSSSCAGVTASSELSAHRGIFELSNHRTILHGHPRFSVIMSMECPHSSTCSGFGECHRKCSRERFIEGIPIVPGEVGTGPWGLYKTLPPALKDHTAAIVYGHGVFTTGKHDYNDAFGALLHTENTLRDLYFSSL